MRTLPRGFAHLSEVAGEFRSRGVQLYAVDLDETPEDVKPFVEQSGLELTVVMDEGGKIANQYDADAIPQTVIIDRQGIVRFVHVGLSSNLRERLSSELAELLAEASSPPPTIPGALSRSIHDFHLPCRRCNHDRSSQARRRGSC